MLHKSVAIIGAGLSGATCARALHGLVKKVSVFERSACMGGRLFLTETQSTTASFTVSTPFFQQVVEGWKREGLVSEKQAWHVEVSATEVFALGEPQTEYVALPYMFSLVEHLLKGTTVTLDCEITELEQYGKQWRLFDFEGTYLGLFDCVIVTSSTPSVYDLVKPSTVLLNHFKRINYAAAWQVVLGLSAPAKRPYDAAVFINSPIAHACFDTEHVTLTATPEWSEAYAALSAHQVADELCRLYCEHTEVDESVILSRKALFWPYKAPINTLGEDCLFDPALGLGACGDWCTSPRVEGAVLSGFSVADRVMKYFSQTLASE